MDCIPKSDVPRDPRSSVRPDDMNVTAVSRFPDLSLVTCANQHYEVDRLGHKYEDGRHAPRKYLETAQTSSRSENPDQLLSSLACSRGVYTGDILTSPFC
jgi:hypothetical protein